MRAPVGSILLLVLAAVLYAAMLSCLLDATNGDAFGRALALAYGAILGTALWIVLAVLLTVAAVRGRMPVWAIIGLAVLVPLSCVVMWFAGDAYASGDASAIWVPALLPPLLALYALWARLPALHATLRAVPTTAVLGAAIVYLTVAPLVAMTRAALPDPARDARLEAAGKAQEEQRAEEQRAALDRQEAQFASLGPDSPLASYLIYLTSMAYGERALAGIRQVRNRQADAIALLQQGRLADLRDSGAVRRRAHARALPGLWRGAGRRRRQDHQGAHGLSHDRHRPRTAADQHQVAGRQPLRPRPAARPARDQPARRRRFRPHDQIRRHAGGAAPDPAVTGRQRPC